MRLQLNHSRLRQSSPATQSLAALGAARDSTGPVAQGLATVVEVITPEEKARQERNWKIYGAVATVSSAAGAYHGYRRNGGSLGWALWWFLMGGMFPIITPVIAVAQGFGKPTFKTTRTREE